MPSVRIGITSPLVADEEPTADMGVAQHRAILERLGVTSVLLRNDEDPLTVLDRFALNGVIFSGGEADIAPERYGGDAHLTHDADLGRDAFEFALMECMLRSNLPIFAVCRGMQIVNVCLNGTLIEALRLRRESGPHVIHDQVSEANLPYSAYVHEITIVPGTLLYDIVGAQRISVNSIHHQAIGMLAPSLKVVARADDGVVEAIEFSEQSERFFLGVQWHPEWLPADSVFHHLYTRFVGACSPQERN